MVEVEILMKMKQGGNVLLKMMVDMTEG